MFLISLIFVGLGFTQSCLPPPSSLDLWVENFMKVSSCAPLKEAGDARIQDATANSSRSNDNRYTLRRHQNNLYEMSFNLNFIPDTGVTSPKDMMARVQSCLKAIPPIQGPQGQKLIFSAFSPTEASVELKGIVPPKIDIKLTNLDRGNANNFGDGFTCGHFTHELMHHAGLCDEYHESGYGIPDANRNDGWCRRIGPGDSLMSSGMVTAYDQTVGDIFSCDLSTDPNMKKLEGKTENEIRDISRRSFRTIGNFSMEDVGYISAVKVDNVKDVYCKRVAEKWIPFVPGTVGITLKSNTNERLTFTSRENYVTSTDKKVTTYEIEYDCDCSSREQSCYEYLNLARPQVLRASDPSIFVMDCPGSSKRIAPSNFSLEPGRVKMNGTVLDIRNQPGKRSLLYPGQFEKLLAGSCSEVKAQNYNKCSVYSYRHSTPSAVKNAIGHSCDSIPEECKSPQGWLGVLPTLTNP
ncbi:MAG: hypothetical protein K2P81_06350 [Bacteriovoracaceae bacterium]|nr:hypothetical protein [Bacteriovoracaceae bacterium]